MHLKFQGNIWRFSFHQVPFVATDLCQFEGDFLSPFPIIAHVALAGYLATIIGVNWVHEERDASLGELPPANEVWTLRPLSREPHDVANGLASFSPL